MIDMLRDMHQPFIPSAEQLKAAFRMAAKLDMITDARADMHCQSIDQQWEIIDKTIKEMS